MGRAFRSGVMALCAVLAGSGSGSAAVFTVTNTNDFGPGSLRQAIGDANAAPGADEVVFSLPLPATIDLSGGTGHSLTITSPLTITGPGADNLTIRRDADVFPLGILAITSAAAPAVTITGVTLRDGVTIGTGGSAILVGDNAAGLTLTVMDCVLALGYAAADVTTGGHGGAIKVGTGAALTVRRVEISQNAAAAGGGGIYLTDSNPLILEDSSILGNVVIFTGGGGGLYHNGNSPVTIRGTTIAGNIASGLPDSRGGGIFSIGGAGSTPVILIESSTISVNTASDAEGGGIARVTASGSLTITHSTITANHADGTAAGDGGGGIFSAVSPTFAPTLRNTIVSGNTAVMNGPDILTAGAGTVNANFSAIGSPLGFMLSGTSGDNLPFGTDLMLGPLEDNGGPTLTHEPGPNTPSVNAGDPAFVPPPDFDQRGSGFARVIGGVLDIGSVERDPVPVEAQEFTVE